MQYCEEFHKNLVGNMGSKGASLIEYQNPCRSEHQGNLLILTILVQTSTHTLGYRRVRDRSGKPEVCRHLCVAGLVADSPTRACLPE